MSNILKGTHLTVNARTEEDVDTDVITEKLSKFTASAYSFDERLDLSKDGFQKMVCCVTIYMRVCEVLHSNLIHDLIYFKIGFSLQES